MSESAYLPAIHILHLLEVAGRWQVTPEELLEEFDLKEESLSLPNLRLPVATSVRLFERARELTGEPALGVYVGLQMKVSWHGFLGFAAMSAKTIGDALELAAKFAPTRTSALELRLIREDERAIFSIDEKVDLGSARDAILFTLIIGFAQMGSELMGRPADGCTEFAFDEPDYFPPFRDHFGGEISFSMPTNRIIFDADVLALPMPQADAGALELARKQCEEQLAALARESDIVSKVRSQIGQRAAAEVAKELGMSARTMKRRLAAAGTSFSQLTNEVRKERAMDLLGSERTIDDIAEELGYSDGQSFARAFRRWTGLSPSAYRKSRQP